MTDISIIIPAYNEENAIEDTLSRCQKILKNLGEKSEIVVVDDASTDRTVEILKKASVKLIRHPHNIGYGRSLKDGIKAANNDTIVITDADGTYPIEDIPKLTAIYQEGFDMVVGARHGKQYRESFKKKILRRILKFLVEYTAGRKIQDINSGLRVFSKKTVIGYFDTLCDTFSFTTSMTLAYMMTGKFVTYTPINYETRIGKTKVKMFRDTLRTLQFILEAILYYNPLKIYLLFSIFLLIIGLSSLVVAYFTTLSIAYILGIAAILLAILNLSIGMLSIQLKQLLIQGKNAK
jgi:glycosyltransferase involved in cell wall biosynthesis